MAGEGRHQDRQIYHSELTWRNRPEMSNSAGVYPSAASIFEHKFNELIRCKNKISTLH
jgi:hypothetical protein